MTIIEKIECYSQFPRRAGIHHTTQDQRDSTRVIQGANRLRRKEVLHCDFHQKEWTRQDKQTKKV